MTDSLETEFTLETREEVARFEELADAYAKEKILIPLRHISLVNAYDYCQTRADGKKLFAALFDIYLNYLLLYSDSVSTVESVKGDVSFLETGSALESELRFFRHLEMHKYSSSFILRYRALWDKLMGFTVLFFAPRQYERFAKSKSRRNSFRKIISSLSYFPKEFIANLDSHLEGFDNKFRTPEAHGTGSLRKRSFANHSFLEGPVIELTGYWNFLLMYMVAIGKLFPPNDAASG